MRKKSEPATPAPERRSARERLLEAANELFYEGGIHTVGIDRVIERAGVAKASLYDTFGSKEALVSAYLEARHAANRARIEAWIAPLATPRGRLLGVFDAMAVAMEQPGFRGCAFARASSESTPSGAVRGACDTARNWMRGLFARLASEAGVADAESLATQLVMLYDGASLMGQMERSPAPAHAAKQAAAALLDAAPKAARGRRSR
jgi:AcrR family transcriptional regulator